MNMLPNDHHPGPRCSCRDCRRAYPEPVLKPTDTEERILAMALAVLNNPRQIGVYSTGEQIAVALVLNKPSMFPKPYTAPIDAIDRLGDSWLRAVIKVRRFLVQTGRVW